MISLIILIVITVFLVLFALNTKIDFYKKPHIQFKNAAGFCAWACLISFLVLAGALVDAAWSVFLAALMSFIISGFIWMCYELKNAPIIKE